MEIYQMAICIPHFNGTNFTDMFKLKNTIKDMILEKLFRAVNQCYESQVNSLSERNNPDSMGFIFKGERFRRTNLERSDSHVKDFVQLNRELYAKADKVYASHKVVENDLSHIETMINALFTGKFEPEKIISALPPELYDLIKEDLPEEDWIYNPTLYKEKKIYLVHKPIIQRYLGTLLLCQ